jgi:hypothetical protein
MQKKKHFKIEFKLKKNVDLLKSRKFSIKFE